eukprot:TRINITY_DN8487_c0_g2_i1.p1 TRINITY_DN8487_c0_g2~~TRINITY_DN8487_c0_g2_i1.p1  ORF type:complete len:105 (+),score=8.55 TRINITY_DN8487_c0_g2_i1:167-481(+)
MREGFLKPLIAFSIFHLFLSVMPARVVVVDDYLFQTISSTYFLNFANDNPDFAPAVGTDKITIGMYFKISSLQASNVLARLSEVNSVGLTNTSFLNSGGHSAHQ